VTSNDMIEARGGRLSGRTVVVTGASRGIGRAIAVACAGEGAAVAAVARTEQVWDERLPGTIHEVVDDIRSRGGTAMAIAADLSQPGEVETILDRTRAELGPVLGLVNNAALTVPGRPNATPRAAIPTAGKPLSASDVHSGPSFLSFPLRGLRQHFEIGLFASYRLMQLALPDMIAATTGAIVNISSMAGFIPGEGPYEPDALLAPIAYGGNKAALHHLTQVVAQQAQPYGVAVNVLSPSEPVLTPGNLLTAAGESNWASPEAFAEATVRLLVADPNRTTGQLLWSEDVLRPELGRRGWLR
jgi:7-alpha-hydroxysteroid dehydrogenase